MKARRTSALVAAFVWAFHGCGGDGPTEPEDELSAAEWEALVEILVSGMAVYGDGGPAFGSARGASGARPAGPARQGGTETFPVDETIPWPGGGSIRVTGEATVSYDDVAETGSYAHELVQVHQGCRAPAGQGLGTFVLDGDPSIVSEVSLGFDAGTLTTFSGTEEGRVRWGLGDRGGRCALDVAYGVAGTPSSASEFVVSGTACARPIERSFAIEGASPPLD